MTRTPAPSPGRTSLLLTLGVVAGALGVDLLVPGHDGLTLPLYTGAVLWASVRVGAGAGLAVGVAFAAVFVGVYGPHASDTAVVGAAALLLGASLVGRVVDGARHRIAQLEQVLAAGADAAEPAPTSVEDPAATAADAPAPRRVSTGDLPRLIYRYARLLNVTEEDAIYSGLALTLEEALPAERVAVHRVTAAGFERVAGDPLEPPDRAMADGDSPVFGVAGDRRTAYGRVRAGIEGPVAAVIVVLEPGAGDRRRALRLLGTFVEWASASVGHARALQRLDVGQRAESARRAEARGRAAARFFAETGSLPLIPAREEPPTAPDRDDLPVGGTMRGYPPPTESGPRPAVRRPVTRDTLDTDDTERIEPQAIAEALAAERRAHPSDALPFGPARPEIPLGVSAATPTRIDAPPLIERPARDHLGPEVRAAVERMARRLSGAEASMSDPTPETGPHFSDYELAGHGRIDDAMVSAEALPLIGGPGLGVATEVGRSPVKDHFTHLLADLSDHLDGEEKPEV